MQQGTSLKSIEAHLGMNIEETQVDFDIDRPLTTEELKLTIQYCKFDVQATEKLCEIRKDYLLSNALCLHVKEMIELQNAIEIDNVKPAPVGFDGGWFRVWRAARRGGWASCSGRC